MNEVWNLEPIYHGFDDPAFNRDLAELKVSVSDFAKWSQNLGSAEPLEDLKAGIAHQEKLYTIGSKLVEYGMLRQSANTQDPEAGSRVISAGRNANLCNPCNDDDCQVVFINAWHQVKQDQKRQNYIVRNQQLLTETTLRWLLSFADIQATSPLSRQ